jgi:uncharacterized membrane protein YesL
MASNRIPFGEGPIFTISNYLLSFIVGNIYFTLLNLPIIFILVIILANGENAAPVGFNAIIFISCIPIGSALTAFFSLAGKLVRNKDINITKDLFKAYKLNFGQGTFLWSIEMLIIIILLVIARFLASHGFPSLIVMIYYWFIIFTIIIGLYMLIILSRFKMKSLDILKLSLYYFIRKVKNTLLMFCIISIVVLVSIKLFVFIFPLIASFIFFIIMFFNQNILIEIEEDQCNINTINQR